MSITAAFLRRTLRRRSRENRPILLQFFDDGTSFQIAICLSFFDDRTLFRAKGGGGQVKSQFYLSFLAIEPHFVQKGCGGRLEIAILGDRTPFRAKGWFLRSNAISRFVPSRWHCPCLLLQKRSGKEGEGKDARGEDVTM